MALKMENVARSRSIGGYAGFGDYWLKWWFKLTLAYDRVWNFLRLWQGYRRLCSLLVYREPSRRLLRIGGGGTGSHVLALFRLISVLQTTSKRCPGMVPTGDVELWIALAGDVDSTFCLYKVWITWWCGKPWWINRWYGKWRADSIPFHNMDKP